MKRGPTDHSPESSFLVLNTTCAKGSGSHPPSVCVRAEGERAGRGAEGREEGGALVLFILQVGKLKSGEMLSLGHPL